MNTVEIIVHCWAEEHPLYAAMLNFQLSSVVMAKDKHLVTVTVCCLPNDKVTNAVVDYFAPLSGAKIKPLFLQGVGEIGQRSIGRNLAALKSTSNIVWFTDADYVFRPECFHWLINKQWEPSVSMMFPRQVMIHRNHAIGTDLLRSVAGKPQVVWCPDLNDFVPKRYARAIGGAQIVRGDIARRHGYIPEMKKYQTPTNNPFGLRNHKTVDTPDDVAYRRECAKHGKIVAVDLPGIYRLRHEAE